MNNPRFLQCLAADEARLRAVAASELTAQVPTCPEWTVADLVEHVAMVYLHKVECMRLGKQPPWPPDVDRSDPVALLDRAYAELTTEFSQRSPESPSFTWYDADQSVAFWIRRMAQETVIHRVDAELAAGQPITPIPDDLAIDGVDEVLECFLAYGSQKWPDEFGDLLATAGGSAVLVSTGGRGWLLRLEPKGVRVEPAGGDAAGAAPSIAQVSGDPQAVLLYLWRRVSADAVSLRGDQASLDRLWGLLREATQ